MLGLQHGYPEESVIDILLTNCIYWLTLNSWDKGCILKTIRVCVSDQSTMEAFKDYIQF